MSGLDLHGFSLGRKVRKDRVLQGATGFQVGTDCHESQVSRLIRRVRKDRIMLVPKAQKCIVQVKIL
jgi:hypothetical protein